MKKSSLKVIVWLALTGMTAASCVGSFPLFNKLASWNKDATGNKFLNELIFLVISPAYAICGTADLLVLNAIEFWTGDNPLANRVGTTRQVKGEDGLFYAVKTLKDGYEITNPDGKSYRFVYDRDNDAWLMETEGQARELFRFNEDGSIQTRTLAGESIRLTQDAAGLMQARLLLQGSCYAMR